jgi:hypothetical protein
MNVLTRVHDVRGSRPALAVGVLLAIAAGFVALEMLVSVRYGYHRDELYFLAAGRRLAWGYVDQPPLSPATARLSESLFGDSLVGLRLFPALAGGAVVFLTGALARELGGGSFAQALAALAVATSTVFLAVHHLAGPTSYDQLAWAGALFLVARILAGGDPRLWLAVGAVAGVGLLNKHTVLFLAGGLAVGLLTVGPREQLRSPWLWAGVALAALIWLPNLVWQVGHDWPTLEMLRSLRAKNSGPGAVVEYLVGQIVQVGPVLVPVWIAGLVWLLRNDALRPYRALGVAFLAVFAVLLVSGGKAYYLAPMYVALFAAGAFAIEHATADGSLGLSRPLIVSGIVVLAVPGVLFALPVMPVNQVQPFQKLNVELGETVGWPRFADTVADVYETLPLGERDDAVVFTSNYGEAGAIDRFGRGRLQAFSGHNSYWWWGPPDTRAHTAIAVGQQARSALAPFFTDCEAAGRINNGHLDNQEQGVAIYVCRGRQTTWADIWPAVRHYN